MYSAVTRADIAESKTMLKTVKMQINIRNYSKIDSTSTEKKKSDNAR